MVTCRRAPCASGGRSLSVMTTPRKKISHPREPLEAQDARHEEVSAAAHRDERLERRHAAPRWHAGQLELAASRLRHDGIGSVVLMRKLRVVDPGLLDEFELSPDVRVEAEEVQAARRARSGGERVEPRKERRGVERRGNGLAVRAAAT